jgi:hypothetical protein
MALPSLRCLNDASTKREVYPLFFETVDDLKFEKNKGKEQLKQTGSAVFQKRTAMLPRDYGILQKRVFIQRCRAPTRATTNLNSFVFLLFYPRETLEER